MAEIQPEKSPSAGTKVIEVYTKGDTLLSTNQTSEGQIQFRVSSGVLSASSPYFEALFDRWEGQTFSKQSTEDSSSSYRHAEVDDDAEVVGIMMNILHHKSEKVPSAVSVPQLFDVAVFCDKYDTTAAAWPWVQLWLKDLQQPEDEKDPWLGKWLLISYVFKLREIFRIVTRILIVETYANEKGELLTEPEGGTTLPESVPSCWIDKIRSKRNRLIESLLDLLRGNFECYQRKALDGTNVCSMHAGGRTECDVMQLGCLTRALARLGMARGEKQPDGSWSARRIMDVIDEMESYGNRIQTRPLGGKASDHAFCDVKKTFQSYACGLLKGVEGFDVETPPQEE